MIRDTFGQDCAVMCIMSGNFVKRGGPALLDKWDRTLSALRNGDDLVIELTEVYATVSAELFSEGGVRTAKAAGVCDHLVFGSESGDLDALNSIAEVLVDEPPEYRRILRDHLDSGMSFPSARSAAMAEYTSDPQVQTIISSPNNILAVEYLKAIRKNDCRYLKPYTFKREGASYNDEDYDPGIHPSATAIRKITATDGTSSAELMRVLGPGMPSGSLSLLTDRFRKGKCIISSNAFSSDIISRLLSAEFSELSGFAGMTEGLDNRLINIARSGSPEGYLLEDIVQAATTRRYPRSTIRRALFSVLLGIRNTDQEMASSVSAAFYLRILGFSKKGRYLLKIMRKTATLPIITRGSDLREFP